MAFSGRNSFEFSLSLPKKKNNLDNSIVSLSFAMACPFRFSYLIISHPIV
jgi:hypothetical protein